jgi:predicted acylesterase/phospholipase RssA
MAVQSALSLLLVLLLAFKRKNFLRMTSKFSSLMSLLLADLSITKLHESYLKKGFFSLETFENYLITMFESEGIDLRNKVISDAPYPLFICSSNITKKCLTVFKGEIPILAAMAASCCIPVLFCPRIINDNAYIDGGFLTNIILDYVPPEDKEQTLSISIIHDDPKLTPEKLIEIGVHDYLYGLYKVSCLYEHKINKLWNNVDLHHDLFYGGVSDVGELEREGMIRQGYKLTSSFLTKGGH